MMAEIITPALTILLGGTTAKALILLVTGIYRWDIVLDTVKALRMKEKRQTRFVAVAVAARILGVVRVEKEVEDH